MRKIIALLCLLPCLTMTAVAKNYRSAVVVKNKIIVENGKRYKALFVRVNLDPAKKIYNVMSNAIEKNARRGGVIRFGEDLFAYKNVKGRKRVYTSGFFLRVNGEIWRRHSKKVKILKKGAPINCDKTKVKARIVESTGKLFLKFEGKAAKYMYKAMSRVKVEKLPVPPPGGEDSKYLLKNTKDLLCAKVIVKNQFTGYKTRVFYTCGFLISNRGIVATPDLTVTRSR